MPIPFDRGDLHHFGLIVDDVEKAAHHMETTYGLAMRVFEPFTFECRYLGTDISVATQTALSLSGPPHLELVQSAADTHLTVVPGIHHVAYTVEDLEAEAAALEKGGLPLVMGCIVDGHFPSMATYHRDPYGPIIELLSAVVARTMALQLSGKAEDPEEP